MNPYIYVIGTLIFTVYGQIILKWRLSQLGSLPNEFKEKLLFLFKAIFDLFIFSGFIAAFLASICWMAAMTQFEITKVYPFMSIAPALVFIIGIFFLGETFTIGKVIGLIVVILGTIITVKY